MSWMRWPFHQTLSTKWRRNKADLQRGMADRIVEMPLDRLRSRPAGVMLAHMDADANAALEATHPAPFTIGVISMLIFAVTGLALIDLPLMFATVGVLPLVLILSIVSTYLIEKPTARERVEPLPAGRNTARRSRCRWTIHRRGRRPDSRWARRRAR